MRMKMMCPLLEWDDDEQEAGDEKIKDIIPS